MLPSTSPEVAVLSANAYLCGEGWGWNRVLLEVSSGPMAMGKEERHCDGTNLQRSFWLDTVSKIDLMAKSNQRSRSLLKNASYYLVADGEWLQKASQ